MPNSDRIRTRCIPNVNHSLSATLNAYPVSDDINLHWHSKCCCPLNIELKAMDKPPKCMHFGNHRSFLKNWWPPLMWRCCFINGTVNLHSCLQKKVSLLYGWSIVLQQAYLQAVKVISIMYQNFTELFSFDSSYIPSCKSLLTLVTPDNTWQGSHIFFIR